MSMIDPFLDLIHQPKRVVDQIMRQRRDAVTAKRRFDETMKAYRDLVKKPEYAPILEEAMSAMGLNLSLLIEQAMRCSHCVPFASRVTALHDLVLDPVEKVYLDELRKSSVEIGREQEA